MALIKCSECGKEISDKSEVCIHCGCPLITILPESPRASGLQGVGGNNTGLKFATYLVRGIVLVFAFLVLSTVFAFGREIIREIFRSSVITDALSPEARAIIYGLSVGILAAAIAFPGMTFAWKLAKKICFERRLDKGSRTLDFLIKAIPFTV